MFCVVQNVGLTNLNAVSVFTALARVEFATTMITAEISPTKKTARIQQVNILILRHY